MPGKKGAPPLEALLDLARQHERHQDTYRALKQQQAWLMRIEEILDPTLSHAFGPVQSALAKRALWDFLYDIEDAARGTPTHERFVANVQKWTVNLGDGLYACFREPRLPRTNNGMERYLRTLKGQYRRITGRKNWNRYVLRYGAAVAFVDPCESSSTELRRISEVTYQDFRQQQQSWHHSQTATLQRIRYRRNPHAFLSNLEQKWASLN